MSWVDWSLKDRNAGFLRFVRKMIAFRKAHPVLRRRTFFTGAAADCPPEILWHGVEPAKPDFSGTSRRSPLPSTDGAATARSSSTATSTSP